MNGRPSSSHPVALVAPWTALSSFLSSVESRAHGIDGRRARGQAVVAPTPRLAASPILSGAVSNSIGCGMGFCRFADLEPGPLIRSILSVSQSKPSTRHEPLADLPPQRHRCHFFILPIALATF